MSVFTLSLRAGFLMSTVSACSVALAQDDFALAASALQNEVADAHVELMVLPTYPKRALRNGINGEVTVAFTVSRYGRAVEAKITRASPRRVFDDAVLDALKYWFIRPARADVCETTTQQAEQTFRFVHDAQPQVQLPPLVLEGRMTLPEAQQHVEQLEVGTGADGVSTTINPNELVVLKRVEPEYPEKALQRKREGYVTVSFFVEKDGRVTEPKVESAKYGALFNRAALRAMRQWEFAPSIRNGEPVERLGCHEFLFNLDARDAEAQRERIRERTRSLP
ncbi:MAG: energy transducer TonB [Gammaproteobacteria bacterium]